MTPRLLRQPDGCMTMKARIRQLLYSMSFFLARDFFFGHCVFVRGTPSGLWGWRKSIWLPHCERQRASGTDFECHDSQTNNNNNCRWRHWSWRMWIWQLQTNTWCFPPQIWMRLGRVSKSVQKKWPVCYTLWRWESQPHSDFADLQCPTGCSRRNMRVILWRLWNSARKK